MILSTLLSAPRRAFAVPAMLASFAAIVVPARAETFDYPHIPEPMMFDMMRPLGAKRGEFEVNTLVTGPLSGEGRKVHWAPEAEYALGGGFAVEVEFPFVGGRLEELKYGVQSSFGTYAQGRGAHGVQYFGVYDRREKTYRGTVAYMIGYRWSERWSTMSMVGLADLGSRRAPGRNAAVVNHSTFFDASERAVLGLEVNYLGGEGGQVLVMPQVHHKLADKANLQFGVGVEKARGEVARPTGGLRLIREF